MAEYFTGIYSGKKKPTPNDEEGFQRYVASQTLSYRLESQDGIVYNKRSLNELPYHFINSNQFDMLKSECLCNYEWLLAKLCGCGIRTIFDDFYLAISIEPKDKDLVILHETFQLSRAVLEKDPQQLGSQLAGRLKSLIMKVFMHTLIIIIIIIFIFNNHCSISEFVSKLSLFVCIYEM